MTTILAPLDLDPEKARLRAVWDLGDYPAVADRVIPRLGETFVRDIPIRAGQRVLDVAAGAGNAALPAAALGAVVTASDLSDHLLEVCARRAAEHDLAVECVPGDAEALPFDAATFDVVMSCVGAMFAPRHDATAGELVRVCRPGGQVAVLSWTPDGFIGRLLASLRAFLPPPPPGAQPPFLWGSTDHVTELLDGRLDRLTFARGAVEVAFSRPREFRRLFATCYGPIVAIYRHLATDPARTHELEAAIDGLAHEWTDRTGTMRWEYLMAIGTVPLRVGGAAVT